MEVGQDETVAHLSDVPFSQWALDALSGLTKKESGVARMVSTFKEMRGHGFGLRIRKTQFANYNANRVSRFLKPLDELQGIQKISLGKNKNGFWTYKTMVDQVAGVMDMMGFLHPDMQLVFLFDWIYGHTKKQDGRLAVLKMNAKYGGKKGKGMRDTKMVEGCLGKGEVKLWKVLGGDGRVIGV